MSEVETKIETALGEYNYFKTLREKHSDLLTLSSQFYTAGLILEKTFIIDKKKKKFGCSEARLDMFTRWMFCPLESHVLCCYDNRYQRRPQVFTR